MSAARARGIIFEFRRFSECRQGRGKKWIKHYTQYVLSYYKHFNSYIPRNDICCYVIQRDYRSENLCRSRSLRFAFIAPRAGGCCADDEQRVGRNIDMENGSESTHRQTQISAKRSLCPDLKDAANADGIRTRKYGVVSRRMISIGSNPLFWLGRRGEV